MQAIDVIYYRRADASELHLEVIVKIIEELPIDDKVALDWRDEECQVELC